MSEPTPLPSAISSETQAKSSQVNHLSRPTVSRMMRSHLRSLLGAGMLFC